MKMLYAGDLFGYLIFMGAGGAVGFMAGLALDMWRRF